MLSWKVWAKGIAAAVIGGGASAVAAAVTAPGIVNGTRGSWVVLLRMNAFSPLLCTAKFRAVWLFSTESHVDSGALYMPTVKMLERGSGGVECGGVFEEESAAGG